LGCLAYTRPPSRCSSLLKTGSVIVNRRSQSAFSFHIGGKAEQSARGDQIWLQQYARSITVIERITYGCVILRTRYPQMSALGHSVPTQFAAKHPYDRDTLKADHTTGLNPDVRFGSFASGSGRPPLQPCPLCPESDGRRPKCDRSRWAISDILECGWEEPANTSKVKTDVRSCQRCCVMVPFRQVVVQFWLPRSTKPPKRKEAANLGGLH
jgi:hypothetical protein